MSDDDFFIRRFARERDAGNADAARQIWEDACLRKWDLVKILIRGHKFPGGSHLTPEDREDAQNVAMMRILQMGENFRGHTGPEFRAAIKRAVWFACMDVGREVLAYEENIGGSLDDRFEDSDAGRFDAAVEAWLRERREDTVDAIHAEIDAERARELVHWGSAQIKNESYRVVLELTFIEGLSGDEIADRLDITPDNVYQRRARGLKKLGEILRDHRP